MEMHMCVSYLSEGNSEVLLAPVHGKIGTRNIYADKVYTGA